MANALTTTLALGLGFTIATTNAGQIQFTTAPGVAGGVTSVFGRTGDVVAQNGDYSAQQITGAWQAQADAASRLAIPAGLRQVGQTVYQASDDTTWRLIGGTADANWTDITVRAVSAAAAGLVPAVGAANTLLQSTGAAAAWGANLVLGATPATTGNVRLTHASSIVERNFLNTADLNVYVSGGAGDQQTFGSSASARTNLNAGDAGGAALQTNGVDRLTINAAGLNLTVPQTLIGAATAPTGYSLFVQNVGGATNALLRLRASGSTAGNNNGNDVQVEGGRLSGTGLSGGFVAKLNQDDTQANMWIMFQVKHIAAGQRFVSLCFPGAAGAGVTSAQLGSTTGDLVVAIGPCATVPTGSAGGGSNIGLVYNNAGALTYRSPGGTVTVMGPA